MRIYRGLKVRSLSWIGNKKWIHILEKRVPTGLGEETDGLVQGFTPNRMGKHIHLHQTTSLGERNINYT